ncbi:MAG: hypothetical protein ACLF0P_05465 [Thermoanaerobaculia bacterium]
MNDPARLDRLWTWALHEDNLLDSRIQVFLTVHGLLIAAAGFAVSRESPPAAFLWSVDILGSLLALAWIVVQVQSSWILGNLEEELFATDPLVTETFTVLRRKKLMKATRNQILSWFIPSAIVLWWLAFTVAIARGSFS